MAFQTIDPLGLNSPFLHTLGLFSVDESSKGLIKVYVKVNSPKGSFQLSNNISILWHKDALTDESMFVYERLWHTGSGYQMKYTVLSHCKLNRIAVRSVFTLRYAIYRSHFYNLYKSDKTNISILFRFEIKESLPSYTRSGTKKSVNFYHAGKGFY